MINCSITNVGGDGIHLYDNCDYAAVSNNYVAQTGLDGILIQGRAKNGTITNNKVCNTFLGIEIEGRFGSATNNPDVQPCSSMVITGNIIESANNQAILANWSSFIIVNNNSIQGGQGVHFIGCTYSEASNNNFYNSLFGVIIDPESYIPIPISSYITVANNMFYQLTSNTNNPRWPGAFSIKNASNIILDKNMLVTTIGQGGIGIYSATSNVDVVLSNNTVKYYGPSVAIGSNSRIEGNFLLSKYFTAPIFLPSDEDIVNLTINNNDFYGGNGTLSFLGTSSRTASGIVISNNRFNSWDGNYAIFIYQKMQDCIISNNLFKDASKISIWVDQNQTLSNVVASGNIAKGGANFNGKQYVNVGNIW